jgi:protein-S-isoprenylcysteine O-methyltransferase Ste14
MAGTRWWKGSRGEWYVVAQFAVFFLIAMGPRRTAGFSVSGVLGQSAILAGGGLFLLGGLFTAAGFLSLGSNLSILPRPREKGQLVESGAYRMVRHPIYSGIFIAALGWGLWNRSWLLMTFAALLFVVLDLKARREEKWLAERFPDYGDYKNRVKRLIPFIY